MTKVKSAWVKPEVTTLDVEQTMFANWKDYDENYTSFFAAVVTVFGQKPGGS